MGQICSEICTSKVDQKMESSSKSSSQIFMSEQKGENCNQASSIIQTSSCFDGKSEDENKDNLKIKDFLKLQDLGEGAQGKVILVKKRNSNNVFAMKIIKKQKKIDKNLNLQILMERNILLENKHPFLVHLKYSFQTEQKLYLVMEYCKGGALYFYLLKNKKFSIDVSRFIGASIVLGLEYLHTKMKIIYRDLKPENVMISEDGHLKITDFGIAMHVKNQNERIVKSLRGTPEYIAPEVIRSQQDPSYPGFSFECDIWAFGIFLFEIISGNAPFTDENRIWDKIKSKIMSNNLTFTSDFDEQSQDLIRKCLKSEPSERLTWDGIKEHPFFEKIDWNALLNKELESPLKHLFSKNKGNLSQIPKPINETQSNEVFAELNGYTYVPQSQEKTNQTI